MFSQTAEYALRAVVYLASQPGTPRTTQEIAKATQVPTGYLSKVMQSLGASVWCNRSAVCMAASPWREPPMR